MLGGAVGAFARYLLLAYLPFPVFFANLIGSFAIGFVYPKLDQSFPEYIPFISIGMLGAFTTFSTFSLELVKLINTGEALKASVYAASSVVLCFLACYLGYKLSNM